MSGIVSDNKGRASGLVKSGVSTYDDNKLQSNVALLGFKTAVNGSLAKYNLVDQIVDEYTDATGVDASASTNERLTSGVYDGYGTLTPTVTQDADSTGTDGSYTWYKWTGIGAGSYNNNTTQDHEWLVVGGGGAGGYTNGGGGGAGGYRTGTTLSLTGGNTYVPTVGAGGAAITSSGLAPDGSDSTLSGTGITTITSAGGGGGGGNPSGPGRDGGSGGGTTYNAAAGYSAGISETITQYTAAGETRSIQGYAGSNNGGGSPGGPEYGAAGGGGTAQLGQNGSSAGGGDGGIGLENDISGTATWYAGGGGGSAAVTLGDGGHRGGGSDGFTKGGSGKGGIGGGAGSGNVGSGLDAAANTGSGGGGGGRDTAGAGGSGIIILRRLTSLTTQIDLTLQSTDTTASTEADNADMILLMENSSGTATLNTDIKGYISRDSGSNFTQGTLVDEGTWGTNKKILAFHDLDISGQPSGTDMCYKITTHNQSAGSKVTKVHATSIGWR